MILISSKFNKNPGSKHQLRAKLYSKSVFIEMSTLVKAILRACAIVSTGIFFAATSSSQNIEVNLNLSSAAPGQLEVSGVFKHGQTPDLLNWVFPDSYFDAVDLARRIKNLKFGDSGGNEIPFKEFAPGEIVTQRKASRFSYRIDLSIPEKPTSAAHVSWLGDSHGFIMLNDVLPEFEKKGRVVISFALPAGWTISTNEKKIRDDQYEVSDVSTAVFLVGTGWREMQEKIAGQDLSILINGEWQFRDEQAFEMAKDIIAEYTRLLGGIGRETKIFLTPFPGEVEFDRWRAEARGANVLIVSSKAAFESQALQRLHEQLRHEILHLWVPNSLNLTGDYVWFYEGFIVYQALKSGVLLGQIRFEDFLNTLNRANDLNDRRNIKTSILEISKNRWNETSSSVYARGMLIGFLTDLAMLKKSRNKRDISELFVRLLNQNGKSSEPQDANVAVLKIFGNFPELSSIVEDQLKADKAINWDEYLSLTGMEFQKTSGSGKIVIKKDLRGREKALLDKLGYNSWRKLQVSIY